ncbi:MAG: hypothetical protein JJE15_09245 [Desulfobacteraceae bacterium]|nr:hypothetical protein [Desulfobacteraceae bacterium]
MKKREKVILIVMFLAVIYAVYALFLSAPKNASPVPSGEELKGLQALVDELKQNLQKENLSEADTYVLEKVNAEWGPDPFLEKKIEQKTSSALDGLPEDINLNYYGYLEIGKRRVAIINGMEYETGEELELEGYVVRGIYPTKAVIEIRARQSKITLPLVEEVL